MPTWKDARTMVGPAFAGVWQVAALRGCTARARDARRGRRPRLAVRMAVPAGGHGEDLGSAVRELGLILDSNLSTARDELASPDLDSPLPGVQAIVCAAVRARTLGVSIPKLSLVAASVAEDAGEPSLLRSYYLARWLKLVYFTVDCLQRQGEKSAARQTVRVDMSKEEMEQAAATFNYVSRGMRRKASLRRIRAEGLARKVTRPSSLDDNAHGSAEITIIYLAMIFATLLKQRQRES
mmetsp:Transcript_16547/g.40751  ORF Transcript_16547/g.40751 Transcript_16547/m.40751 type:complete len:238 (-) Transcript_16547:119-832(-)